MPGEQQVMLKVRVAELTRTALRELGTDLTAIDGNVAVTNFLTAGTNISAIFDANSVTRTTRACLSFSLRVTVFVFFEI